jgi:cellulose biosynthesis protein BcsQ
VNENFRKFRPKVVGIWMRKGGVGKSNTTYSLGHALAAEGIPTMMVDCDSQQDLTELCFRAAAEQAGSEDTEEYLMTQLTPGQPGIAGKPGRFVHSLAAALDYVLGHRGNPPSDNFKGAPRALPPHGTKCNLLYPQPFPVQCIAPGDVIRDVENLWLVTGGGDFDKMEVRLNSHLERIRLQEHAPVNAPGALFHSIWNAANDCRAQVVLLDVSPALGNTNQNLLLHCDYFLTPCEANKLSEKNLTSIPATFRDWYKQYAGGNPRTAIRDISRGIPYTEDIREASFSAVLMSTPSAS